MRIIDRLIKAVRDTAIYNPEVQVSPFCILWPDRDRQWEPVIARLKKEMPELLILGDYSPEERTGPAIWLRCAIKGKMDDLMIPAGSTPILYLPGVSRQDLRAVESCPDHLKPIAELQYRGVIWSQINAKDWTILAFLKSDQDGLGLDVAQDNDAKNAMQLALYRLLDEDVEILKGKRLDKDFFNTLLTGGDPVRDLLQWLDQGEDFRNSRGKNEWRAFVEVCKSQLAFNPEKDGPLTGASKLAIHAGPWKPVWERYCEAPKRYPNIPNLIKKTTMSPVDLFSNASTHGGWPQWNEEQEKNLRQDLLHLGSMAPHKARKELRRLEEKHSERRGLLWAELGYAPLACSLKHLDALSVASSNPVAGDMADLAAAYRSSGWQADDAVILSLACIQNNTDLSAVQAAIRAIYLPWLEESSRYLQKLAEKQGYPGLTADKQRPFAAQPGECLVFVDGLRYDTAKRLASILATKSLEAEEIAAWAALPSVTATGKPAVSPVRGKIAGQAANTEFEPCVADTGQPLKGGYILHKLLAEAGWDVVDKTDTGQPDKNAWCEFGDIDHEGHDRGWKLARHIEVILQEIAERVFQLIESGWKQVRIVTDHGWLLVPGGLPKTELPKALTENKWGRCAVIKPGASIEGQLFPWFWNQEQNFALADGISCYRQGEEYAHGGLSLQECLNLHLIVRKSEVSAKKAVIEVTDIVWRGMRCTVGLEGDFSELYLDIREDAGSRESSVILNSKPFNSNGTASVVVTEDRLEGKKATIVILNNEELITQVEIVIGGGTK